MSVLIILILVSMAVAIAFLIAFIWSVKSGQYEDDYTPSVRILFDDAESKESSEEEKKEHKPTTDKNASRKV